jgi:hypothetical protein
LRLDSSSSSSFMAAKYRPGKRINIAKTAGYPQPFGFPLEIRRVAK